jgi:hypothetical protein
VVFRGSSSEPLPTGSGDRGGAGMPKSKSGARPLFPGSGESEDTTVFEPISKATKLQSINQSTEQELTPTQFNPEGGSFS